MPTVLAGDCCFATVGWLEDPQPLHTCTIAITSSADFGVCVQLMFAMHFDHMSTVDKPSAA